MKKTLADYGFQNYPYPDHFGEWLGYEVNKVDTKRHVVEVGLEIREAHLSPARRVHGGVIAAFFDFACGAAVFTTLNPKDFCSTVELKVNYFRPLNLGDSLTARSEVMFRGHKLCVAHALLYRRGEATPVAMASATFNVVTESKTKPGSATPSRKVFSLRKK